MQESFHHAKQPMFTGLLSKYFINVGTSSLMPFYYNGYKFSRVIEEEEVFFVRQSPVEIVEKTFREIGSDLTGARKAAHSFLKRKYKNPVVLSAAKNITLIPCMTADKQDYVWLIDSHILEIQPHNSIQTKVHLKGGHGVIIDVKVESFLEKRAHASLLHTSFLKNSHLDRNKNALYKKEAGLLFVKEDGHLNYTSVKKEETKPDDEWME